MSSTVHIVHCIDAEGPLHEPLEATFERVRHIFGVELPATPEMLRRLQAREVDLDGKEEAVAKMLDPRLLSYNDSWDKIRSMLTEALGESFRNQMTDSFGGGWRYNWFCVDHVGYTNNPRSKSLGYHAIFDRYRKILGGEDGLHFHFHPMPLSRRADHCATQYLGHSDALYQILSRRIIDRGWFPSAFRPGFNTIRPDSHWFLEQFLPFDFANQATIAVTDQPDLGEGRFGDWRRAPKTWAPYHPAPHDHQSKGTCRRWIMRCLNVGTRHRLLTKADVEQSFEEASAGAPVVIAFASHDYRDLRRDVADVRGLLAETRSKYPSVRFAFCEAREAVRRALALEERAPCELTLSLNGTRLEIDSDRPIFGPQPFLALKTKGGDYFHDNLDFQVPFARWSYVLDEQTIPLGRLAMIGVATCDEVGNVTVALIDPKTKGIGITNW